LRLITSSNLVGTWTGMSATFTAICWNVVALGQATPALWPNALAGDVWRGTLVSHLKQTTEHI
jgi:hypothetical protein